MGTAEQTHQASAEPSPQTAGTVVTFVVIGYNEAGTLGKCLQSVKMAGRGLSVPSEIIYVDGGSEDESIRIAQDADIDQVLGGEQRRKAAENRNLGLSRAAGSFIQFVDGDMELWPDWPAAALAFLEARRETAAVCGTIREAGRGVFSQALEIDWRPCEGPVRHCGGAAMYRRDTLAQCGGFPEDLPYGEELYLCWRIRNELGMSIFQLGHTMVTHDLGYSSFGEHMRRLVRVGETYIEIAARCARTADRLWLREAVAHVVWAGAALCALAALAFGATAVRAAVVTAVLLVLLRKTAQMLRRGYGLRVSITYAVHSYFAKLPMAWGEVIWLGRRLLRWASLGAREDNGQ